MAKVTTVSAPMKGFSAPPSMTRGLRRQQLKAARRKDLVPPGALVVGIDLGRERHAVSFVINGEILGRRRLACEPQHLVEFLAEAQGLAARHGAPRVVIAFEPAGHYWCLAAEAFERAGAPYVLVHPVSVKRAREESRYTPEKTDPRDADLIAQLAAQGRFTDTRLPATIDEDVLWHLAKEYFRVRKMAAAERTRLHNFWHCMLPEFFSVIKDPTGQTALAISAAMGPLSEIAALSQRAWLARVQIGRAHV